MRALSRTAAAILALLPLSTPVWAAGPQNRILTGVGRADTALPHSVPGRVRSAADLGQAPANQVLPDVTLHFSRTPAQQAAIIALLADQQNPGSARYHKWLTPAQFKQQFGLSDADIARVSSWLSSQGLTVTGTALTNTSVSVRGSVAQLQSAFGVSLHTVRVAGEQHITNVNDPVLPSAIASVTRGITGLSDFKPHSHLIAKPALTASSGSHYLTPGDINTIYDLKPLLASAVNGTNITIGVMGQTTISLADVAAFRSAAGLPANVPNVSYTANLGVSANDLPEAQLDVEWSGAIAPNATIDYIATSSALTSLQNAIANIASPPKILTISYGLCEQDADAGTFYVFDQYFQQAGTQGQTIISSAGDSGATDCDYTSFPQAADGLAADFPASSPNVTGIGGTSFNEGSGNYWNTANASDDSSALSYIPETVWNEDAVAGTSGGTQLASGGGGASIFFTKPSWQVGTGVPADSVRDVPDIALDAAVYHDGYVICVSGSCAQGFKNTESVGGTSVGAPIFAGMLALVEQKNNFTGGLGNINPMLYGLAAGTTSVFHDVTTGNNQSPCVIGSPNCTTSPIGYLATAGYDLASGWGSVDGNNLASLWTSATPTGSASTTGGAVSLTSVSLPANTVSCGISSGSLAFTASIAPYPGQTITATPTGTVQLFVDGAAVGSALPLSSGAAGLTLNTATLSSGGHTIAVAYSGDSNYAPSRGNLSPSLSPSPNSIYVPSIVDVALTGSPDFAISPCQPSITVAAGGSASTPITLTALNGFSGQVTLTASSDGNLQGTYGFSSGSVQVSGSGAATSTFTVQAFTKTATTSAANSNAPSSRGGLYRAGAGGAALASLLFFTLPRRRRYIGLLTLVLSAGAIGLGGCGSGVSTIPSGTGLPNNTVNTSAGFYIINVTASGTNSLGQPLTHTSYVTLQVQ